MMKGNLCHDLPVVRYGMATEKEMNSFVKEVKGLGRRAIGIKCDVRKPEDIEKMAKRVFDEFGKVNILFKKVSRR